VAAGRVAVAAAMSRRSARAATPLGGPRTVVMAGDLQQQNDALLVRLDRALAPPRRSDRWPDDAWQIRI